ncbi:hypothetical protein Hte_010214 [Hypoxylon texense]
MSAPLETFELFGQLPYELRRLIWDYSLDSFPPRLYQIGHINRLPCWSQPPSPPTVQACRESRAAAVSYYAAAAAAPGRLRGRRDVQALSATGWFRPETDILYFKAWQAPSRWIRKTLEHTLARLGSEYRDYRLASVRHVAFHHRALHDTVNTRLLLQPFYSLLPSIETVYWLVPQRVSEVGTLVAERGASFGGGGGDTLPASLVEIPDECTCVSYRDPLESRWLRTWWEIKGQLAKEMHKMAERGGIPREPEVVGVFLVTPESPGKHGTFREYDQARNDV